MWDMNMPDEIQKTEELNNLDIKILYYIHNAGPAYIKKLGQRMHEDFETIRQHTKKLQRLGFIERVSGRIVDYQINRRNKATKHRNHTYYDVTRKGRQFIRNTEIDVDVDLKPPYKRT
jgi:predicted transcriptional regulator